MNEQEPITSITPIEILVEIDFGVPGFFRRPVNPDAVRRLMKSIERERVKVAIYVSPILDGIYGGKYKLVTGAHRHEACLASWD